MGQGKHPRQIGAYLVDRMIGRGAMGVVYAARHQESGQAVALKTLQPKRLSGTVEAVVERFAHEVIAMNSLQHPGIVRVFDWDRVETEGLGEVLFFAMELLEGETLEQSIKHGPFHASEACILVLKIAEALRSAHAQDIVHRDIKPANVFLTNDRRVVITDFGVCKLTNVRPVTTVGSFIGTAPFLAPEVVQQGEVDHRADLFSLGALFYNLLTRGFLRPISSIGELLYSITQGEEINRVRQLQGFDPRIIEVLAHCVEKDPSRRFQDAGDVVHALLPLAGNLPTPGTARQVAPIPHTLHAAEDATAYQIGTSVLPPSRPKGDRPDWLLDSSVDPLGTAAGLGGTQARTREQLFDSGGLQSYTFDGAAFDALPSDPMIAVARGAPEDKARVYLSQDAVREIGQGGGPDTAAFAFFGLTPDMVAYLDHRDMLRAQMLEPAPTKPQLTAEQQAEIQAQADSIDVNMLGLDLNLDKKVRRRPPWRAIGVLAGLSLLGGLGYLGLTMRTVELPIESDPPGATVRVDGEELGVTPVHKDARRGQRFTLEVQAPDREPHFAEVSVPLLGAPPKLDIELPLSPAMLQLSSTPGGAVVTVDSAAACRTPCTVTSLVPQRKHLVAIDGPGCAPASFVVEAEPGGAIDRESALEQLQLRSLALLRIKADPGRVELDGEAVSELVRRGPFFVFGGEHLLRVGSAEQDGVTLKVAAGSCSWIDLRVEPEVPPKPTAPSGPQPRPGERRQVSEEVDYGVYLLGQGRAGSAEAHLARALRRDPADPFALRALIALAIARGDLPDAQRHARVFTELPRAPADAFRVQRVLDVTTENKRCGADMN